MQCDMVNGVATIRAKFNDAPEMEDSQITMSVNGTPLSLSLGKLGSYNWTDSIKVVGVGTIKKNSVSVGSGAVNIISTSTSDKDYDVYVFDYVNDRKIMNSELNKIPHDSIVSVTIDPTNSKVRVVLKK